MPTGKHGSTARGLRSPLAAAAGVVAVALVVVVVWWSGSRTSADEASVAAPADAAATATAAAPTTSGSAAGPSADSSGSSGAVPGPSGAVAAPRPRGLDPVRIQIPAIGVDASMTDLGIADDGSIEVPSEPAQAGWLDTTPVPGERGPAVVAGHVDSTTGPAVFYRLDSLTQGDEVTVTLRNGTTARFSVDGVRTYAQDRFPTDEVYGPAPGPVLRLITCGGDYVKDQGGYQSNVVVYAS